MWITAIPTQNDRAAALLVKWDGKKRHDDEKFRAPTRALPIGTKYVLEGRGALVQRYIELPNGHRIKLKTRIRRIASPSFARVSGDDDAGWGNEPRAADTVLVRG